MIHGYLITNFEITRCPPTTASQKSNQSFSASTMRGVPLQIKPSIVSCSGTESIAHESRGPSVKLCGFPAETMYTIYIVPLKIFRNGPEPLLHEVNLDHYTQEKTFRKT